MGEEEVIKYEDLGFPYSSDLMKEMEEEQPIGIKKKMEYKGQLLDVVQDDRDIWLKTLAKNLYALIGRVRVKRGRKKKTEELQSVKPKSLDAEREKR